VSCKRCGDFYLDGLLVAAREPRNEEERVILSGYTKWENVAGNSPPEIRPDNIDEILRTHSDLSAKDKVDLILLFYSAKNPKLGHRIKIDYDLEYPIIYSHDGKEFDYLVRDLSQKVLGFLEVTPPSILRITPKGWERLELLKRARLADEKFELIRKGLYSEAEKKIADLKEKHSLKGTRYSSALARGIRDIIKESLREELTKKVLTDEKIILSIERGAQPEDIYYLSSRLLKVAEHEKVALLKKLKAHYEECHGQAMFEVDKVSFAAEADDIAKSLLIDVQTRQYMRKATGMETKPTLSEVRTSNPKKVFVVHGRNEKARRAMFDFLRSLGLEPIEWGEALRATGKGTPYVGEAIEKAFSEAQAVVVLLTGDDMAKMMVEYLKDDDPQHERNLTPQARTNVIFEAGMAFGTHPDRTILVELANEKTRPFSDIYGRHVVKISNRPESRQDLINRLQTANCEVNIEGKKDWLNSGDFDRAILVTSAKDSGKP